MSGADSPRACNVLVAEDVRPIADEVVRMLQRLGCTPVGPVPTVAAGLSMVKRQWQPIDAAVLDIALRDEPVFPLAHELRTRGIPFVFATGYCAQVLPPDLSDVPCVEKPFDEQSLHDALARARACVAERARDAAARACVAEAAPDAAARAPSRGRARRTLLVTVVLAAGVAAALTWGYGAVKVIVPLLERLH